MSVCELEILEILLTVDLRVMDMSDFDVILRMDWFVAHRVAPSSTVIKRGLLPMHQRVFVSSFREKSMMF